MRTSLKSLFVTAAFGFVVVGCAPGTGGDGGEPECASDTDCEGSLQCHPGLGVCVEDCSLDESAACSAEAPVCNEADDNGDYPLELEDADADQAFRLLCICVVDGDCGTGEICDPDTRECVEGEAGDAGPGPDECTVPTEDVDCGADEFCIDGSCEPACVDDDCIATGELCQYIDTDAEFNQCVIADEVTATCTDAAEAPAQEGPPHIVVYGHEADLVTANACGSNGDLSLRTFFFDIFSEVTLEADHIYRANFADGGDRFFGHGDGDTLVQDLGDDEFYVTVFVCGNPNEIALYVDTGAAVSNAYCFEATP